ncbi:MAG: ABC transporter ATP-binding protein [Chloroflexota bacterium]
MHTSLSPWHQQMPDAQSTVEHQHTDSFTQDTQFSMDDVHVSIHYIRRYWSPYMLTGIVTGVTLMSLAAYQLLYAYTLQIVIDNVLVQGHQTLITNALLKLFGALPFALGGMLFGERLGARLSSRIAGDIRYDLFAHLQTLPPTFHKDARLGDILARFSTDIDKVELAMGKELMASIGDVVMLLVNLILMMTISLPLTLFNLALIALMRRPLLKVADYFFQTGYAMQQQKGLMVNAAQEGIRAQTLVEGFGIGDFIRRCFGDELAKLEDKNTNALFGKGLFMHSASGAYLMVRLAALAAGTMFVLGGAMTLGSLFTMTTLMESFYFSYAQLTNLRVTQWVEAGVGLRRLDELFQQQPLVVDAPHAHSISAFSEALHFEHVTFGYKNINERRERYLDSNDCNGHKQIQQLIEINLTIQAGQFVAFVGPSGAGKSTIFNLLMRFYDVNDGRITMDGYDLREITVASLRTQIGIVLQETFLFNTTIDHNIRVVKPEATEREVVAAAQAAELHDFIVSLPDGYQTVVGENGGRLSGGQRQRIAIARALLMDPAILLLDEATSSLDPETAATINETLQRVAQHRTVIMITHHLPSVINADTIFVLNEGHLVEQGTHETLLEESSVYKKLWMAQSGYIQTAYGHFTE